MNSHDLWSSVPDDELEETVFERLWGLREMFPESIRNKVDSSVKLGLWAAKTGFWMFRNAVWIGATTSMVMLVPYLIEKERGDFENIQCIMFAVRRGVIRFILCHETIFALRYSAHANDEAFAKGDKDSNGQCAHSDFHCPTTDVNNLVGSCDQKFNDVTHANRYRKILYSEGELDRTDFSIPPSRSNPYSFDPAAEPTLLPPTHSRSLIPYVNHVPLLQNLVDLGMNLYEVIPEIPA